MILRRHVIASFFAPTVPWRGWPADEDGPDGIDELQRYYES